MWCICRFPQKSVNKNFEIQIWNIFINVFYFFPHCCTHLQIHGGGLVGFRGRLVVWAGGERGGVSGDWGDAQSFQPRHWAYSMVRKTHTQSHTNTHTVYNPADPPSFPYFLLLGTCCRYNPMFTSFCCRGLRSSTTTRTATSQLAVCCDYSRTTQHSPGVNSDSVVILTTICTIPYHLS